MDGTADAAGGAADSKPYGVPAFTAAVEAEFRAVLGGNLRAERKRQGMTLDDAANATGQSANAVSWHENGKSAVSVPRFVQYCAAYWLAPGDFLDRALAEATGERPTDTVTVNLAKLARSGNPLASWAEVWLRYLPPNMCGRLRLPRPAQDEIAELCGCDREQFLNLLEANPPSLE